MRKGLPVISLIDSHAHLDMDAFDQDREGVISRARTAGVQTIITVGIDLEKRPLQSH
ncbi:MAG: TatD family hydrolase [Chloroflexi bacterium]|nr:TatD family hydrolase [Chloroflexota bacterium]